MEEMQIFSNESFGDVRTINQNEETWFVAADVCRVLGLEDTGKATARLDEDELTRIKIVSGGQGREVIAVNEPGVYALILSSRKPEAKQFKRWITHEVLPTIRRKGYYSTLPPEELANIVLESVNDDWKFENVVIPALRNSDRRQEYLIQRYLGISRDEMEKMRKLCTISYDNWIHKSLIEGWKKAGVGVYSIKDLPEPYCNSPYVSTIIRDVAKKDGINSVRFTKFCGTLYFNQRGFRMVIDGLVKAEILDKDQAAALRKGLTT